MEGLPIETPLEDIATWPPLLIRYQALRNLSNRRMNTYSLQKPNFASEFQLKRNLAVFRA